MSEIPSTHRIRRRRRTRRTIRKDNSLMARLQEGNRLTQCLLSGAYYIFYTYYLELEPNFLTRLNLLSSLISFLVALLASDFITFSKACPSLSSIIASIPGLHECISLIIAANWMICSLCWLLSLPTQETNSLLSDNLPYLLTYLSVFNWISWTGSFMF